MKKTFLTICLALGAVVALTACSTANSSEATKENANQNQEVREMINKEKAVAVLESL